MIDHIYVSRTKPSGAHVWIFTPLARAFGTLKKYGVEVDGNEITITNPEDLQTLAKPNPLIDVRGV